MNQLSDLGVIEELLSRHGFHLSHKLGQNFLVNPSVCPKMAALSGAGESVCALEIGPGIGVLTKELAKVAKKVVAIEIDERLLPVLSETLAQEKNVEIIRGDAMEMDLQALFQERFSGERVVVCANLPYYITSPLLMKLLEEKLPIEAITVMVQKEAAARLSAEPGVRECGAVSAAIRYYSEPKVLFSVSRGSFCPPPKVDSAVIRLTLHKEPPVKVHDEAKLFEVVRTAFLTRRKTILNSLSAGLSLPKAQVTEILQNAGVAQTARAENLSLAQFAAIANGLSPEKEI